MAAASSGGNWLVSSEDRKVMPANPPLRASSIRVPVSLKSTGDQPVGFTLAFSHPARTASASALSFP